MEGIEMVVVASVNALQGEIWSLPADVAVVEKKERGESEDKPDQVCRRAAAHGTPAISSAGAGRKVTKHGTPG